MSKIVRVLYNHVNHIREVPDDMDPQEVLEQIIVEKGKLIPTPKNVELKDEIDPLEGYEEVVEEVDGSLKVVRAEKVSKSFKMAKLRKVEGGFNVVRGDKLLTDKPLTLKDAEAFARSINLGAVVEPKPDILGV